MSGTSVNAATQAFLEQQTNLVLATSRRDGSPQMSPVWYLWRDGVFVISTIASTAKWRNLQRDPRCAVCVDDPATERMVVAYGAAELDDGDVWDRTRELVEKYRRPDEVQGYMDRIFADQKRVLITVRPERLVTRLLPDGSEGGAGSE